MKNKKIIQKGCSIEVSGAPQKNFTVKKGVYDTKKHSVDFRNPLAYLRVESKQEPTFKIWNN